MTKRQFVVLVFRLFALYLAFSFFVNLGYLLNSLHDPFTSVAGWIGATGAAASISLLLIWLLWRKSEWLMKKVLAVPVLADAEEEGIKTETSLDSVSEPMIEGTEENYYESALSTESVQIVAISLMGLWAIFTRLPHLFTLIEIMFEHIPSRSIWFGVIPWLPDAIVVALGLWLFLRPWQFQRWVERFKPKQAPIEESAN